jgi:hypothetical protein
MTLLREAVAALAVLTLPSLMVGVDPAAPTPGADEPLPTASVATAATPEPLTINSRARLVSGAIRVTVVAKCADITGGESWVTVTVSQVVDRGQRVAAGSATRYADCLPRSEGGTNGRVTVPVSPEGAGKFHTGSAFGVLDDTEGIRLGDDYGYFDTEAKWAELMVRRPGQTASAPTRGVTGDGVSRGADGTTAALQDRPRVTIDDVSAGLASLGAGVIVRVTGSCRQGSEFGYAEQVSVTVAQGTTPSTRVTGTKESPAYESLACEDPDPGWIDVPVIPDGRPFSAGRAAVEATFSASFGPSTAPFTRTDTLAAKRYLRPQ